jgi:hypothetical protein
MLKAFMFGITILSLLSPTDRKKSLRKELKKVYKMVSRDADSIFLADTIISDYKFDYEELRQHILVKDTQLLRVIIDSGRIVVYTATEIQELLAPYKVNRISYSAFFSVHNSVAHFSKREISVSNKVDSLDAYNNSQLNDSITIQGPELEERKLMQKSSFKNYLKKLERSRTRLMIFTPFIIYQNNALIVMIYEHSMTNSTSIVRIVHF